jgi:hypothetical protein
MKLDEWLCLEEVKVLRGEYGADSIHVRVSNLDFL